MTEANKPRATTDLSLSEVQEAAAKLAPYLWQTPVVPWVGRVVERCLGAKAQVFFKLELMQVGGSFKVRGALLNAMSLSAEEKKRGVVAVSAGNHAIAVSYAAEMVGASAVVVMPKDVSCVRVERCRSYGAKVVLVDSLAEAFLKVEEIQQKEGRILIHPYEGRQTVLGTATLGLEFLAQVQPQLDAVVLAIGGGGLAAGVSALVAQSCKTSPDARACAVYGVEPEGADLIFRSLQAKSPLKLEKVSTIADSLSPLQAMPYSYALIEKHLRKVVRVSDQALCEAMAFLYYELKLAVEPAAAASLAALLGPLREELQGKRVGLVLSGASIDANRFYEFLQRGEKSYFSCLATVDARSHKKTQTTAP